MHAPNLSPLLGLIAIAALAAGCSQDFPQEMEIKADEKLRPLGVIFEPAEAVPGDTVAVTLRYYDPEPAATTATWKLVLDYRLDRYGELEHEDAVIDLAHRMLDRRTSADEDGIVTESFRFQVPDSCLLVSSAVPEVIDEELPPEIVDLLQPAGAFPTRGEVDAFLAAVDPGALDPGSLAWLQTYGDLFACQIRLRCALRGTTPVNVTRNLTVRYSGRLGSGNVNHNPALRAVGVIDVHADEVEDKNEIADFPSDTTWVWHSDPARPVAHTVTVRGGHTYFLLAVDELESYVSPAGLRHEEEHSYAWYYTRRHDAPDDLFFIKDHNDEEVTEMEELDEIVRIVPPGGVGAQRYLLHLVVRDIRYEWRMFHGTPGAAYAAAEILFEPASMVD